MSETDKKRAMAHCRALARKASYDGHIECWFDRSTGRISYMEIVGIGDGYSESDDMEYIGFADCCISI